ncbi:overexpressed in colon carcinoma 1 protein homolog [Anabas testudineus]|uniref:overexpressed in colon carcinoma 1 protein homolog n=1 Tax=Anabas testudineus TaxID=64144 RepID=UPI000E453CF2|nr:overexpressed in colon carcinoma 1 protein homolog [Anabas testudineus]
MGCGNSSQTNSSRRSGGRTESSSKVSDEQLSEDKRKNYGGVYLGLPTDLSSIPQVQIGSLRETDNDSMSLGKPLWGGGQEF